MKNRNILIISHTPTKSTNDVGKTLAMLFQGFEKNNITQLFFHSMLPDMDVFKSYYQITDYDAMKSILIRKECGRVVNCCIEKFADGKLAEKRFYNASKGRSATKLLLRDLIWKLSAWNGTGLKRWIEGNKPDVIFVTPGYSMFVYDIAMKLSKKYNIPIVTYFFDDFHENVQKKNNPVFAVRRYLFRRKTNQLIKVSRQILTISKTMAEEYSMLFNKPCEALMIPYEKSMILPQKNEYKRPYKFVYAGNVGLNRWITLKMLGESIKRINAGGKILTLDIYSSNQDSSIIEALSIGDDVKYRGFVGAYELHDIFEEADILVHVEGFDSESKLRVKHSISTKIPNYLVCGRPILAIGPKDIASTRHFNESNAAYVIADEKIIEDELRRWFVENSIDENIIQNALALAEKEHSVSQNTNRLSKFFDECEDK